ncbi:MAG: nuclear transport factor 2 family protein [Paraglaciecola sp.]|nr:nuclear transport factor 2 family protein [Paraglaciecola sp.]NCT46762.1 nuclear transport factor 2 family protein [Paraglaciecola sp.]
MHRSLSRLLLIVALLPCISQAEPEQVGSEFQRLIEQLVATQLSYDSNAMAALLHPDYLEVSPKGEVDYREKVLGFYAPSLQADKQKSPQVTLSELNVSVQENLAFVLVKETFAMPNSSQTFSMRVSFVLQKVTDHWLFYRAHYTGIWP